MTIHNNSLIAILIVLLVSGCEGGISGTGDGGVVPIDSNDGTENMVAGDEVVVDAAAEADSSYSVAFSPQNIALDSASNRLFIVDFDARALLEMNLSSGMASIFSDDTVPDSNLPFIEPKGLAIDDSANRVLVVDTALQAIIAVDLNTGARTILSDNNTPNGTPPFNTPQDIVIDTANQRAIITDSGNNTIISVDLSTGERTLLSLD